MDYSQYYEARHIITKIMKQDLLGPLHNDEVIEGEPPVSYYLTGKLYPRNIKKIDENETILTEETVLLEDEDILSLGNSAYPSAIGITFIISKSSVSFDYHVRAAFYELNETNGQSKEKIWVRNEINRKDSVSMEELLEQKIMRKVLHDNLNLEIRYHFRSIRDGFYITVTLYNDATADNYGYETLSKHTYFQPEISVENVVKGNFLSINRVKHSINNLEMLNLELLYHDVMDYASGHGCAVDWDQYDNHIIRIYSKIIPECEVFQMSPQDNSDLQICSMYFLANESYEKIDEAIKEFTENYKEWIFSQKIHSNELEEPLKKAAQNNLSLCQDTCKRIEKARVLLKNPIAFRSFQYMNEAMLEQRIHTKGNDVDRSSIKWYPFQIGFILQELDSIVHPEGEDRDLVDLLWFPTGGGKTEAYLGVASFSIFFRRLAAMNEHKEDEGVAVIMRYTLRLLSFQQFERASSLICAMELIRIRDELGKKSFSIGLWAGSSLTPNTLEDAKRILKRGKGSSKGTPVQVRKCPWCGSRIQENNYSIDIQRKRMNINCINEECFFSSGLPIHLIDEDIYEERPSFIIGTIDKFAQLAFNEKSGRLLGYGIDRPPDLIIQDELHLISGSLGTVAAVYEAAISGICIRNGTAPKVIAATATIRNASSQVKSLFNKECCQFPPQGITMKDSYFAKVAKRESKAARLYMGIMPSGTSKAVAFTRVTGALLFASRYLESLDFDEEVIDSFWTETTYFNTLKDLGSSIVRIIDSLQDRFRYLKYTKFSKSYPVLSDTDRYTKFYELTSRSDSSELGEVLQNQLFIPYKKDHSTRPYDFLVSSNMISVGVDIDRLGNMVVMGQPVKTTEYIQATSRVGRATPGLVIVLYTQTRTRDRSHYEKFSQYHATFYKFVESTSITPFADRSRDRTLQALYVILCRYHISDLLPVDGAAKYRKDLPELKKIRDYIVSYVSDVDPDEIQNVIEEIEEIETYWDEKATWNDDLIYWKYTRDKNTLFQEDYLEGERFRMMNSMRNVEPVVGVETEE